MTIVLLSSTSLTETQAREIVANTNSDSCSIALVENASDPYPSDERNFVYETREAIAAQGFQYDLVDLRSFQNSAGSLGAHLQSYSIIWFTGGSVNYLLALLTELRAQPVLRDLLHGGTTFIGSSAGAVVAGPTIKHFDRFEHHYKTKSGSHRGLNLIDAVPLPHYNNPKFQTEIRQTEIKLISDNFETLPVAEKEMVLISNDGSITYVH